MQEVNGRSYRKLTLWAFADSQIAQGFWAACGFEPDGAERFREEARPTQVRLWTVVS
jgi:hypothetical protein